MNCERCQRHMWPWTRRGQVAPDHKSKRSRTYHRECWRALWVGQVMAGTLTFTDLREMPDEALSLAARFIP